MNRFLTRLCEFSLSLHSLMKRINITKRGFLTGFIVVTLVLSLVKCVFPSVAVKDDGGVIAAMDSVAEMPVVEDNVVVDPRMAGGVGDSMAEKLTTEVADTIRGRGRFLTESILYIVSVRSRRSFLILMPCSLRLLRSMA